MLRYKSSHSTPAQLEQRSTGGLAPLAVGNSAGCAASLLPFSVPGGGSSTTALLPRLLCDLGAVSPGAEVCRSCHGAVSKGDSWCRCGVCGGAEAAAAGLALLSCELFAASAASARRCGACDASASCHTGSKHFGGLWGA
jgi:hypothetical protein